MVQQVKDPAAVLGFDPWPGNFLILRMSPYKEKKSLCKKLTPGFLLFFLIFFAISWAAPVAYGGSQARDLIGAVATGLRQSHSNTGSKPRL